MGTKKISGERIPKLGSGEGKNIHVSDILNFTSLDEEVDATISILPKPTKHYPPSSSTAATVNKGFHTEMQKLLSPPRKKTFQHLREELGETAYKSYWTTELGKVPDQVPNLPVGLNPESALFGKPSRRTDEDMTNTVSNVVFPKKPYGEVQLESELGMKLYRRSHNEYWPGQRRDLFYDAPENVTFGKHGLYDKRGFAVKENLQWFVQTNVTRTSKRLAKFKERTYVPFGRVFAPNKIIKLVGKDFTFGIKTASSSGVRQSLIYGPENNEKYEIGAFLSYICSLREKLKKRIPPFPFFELLANFKLLDHGKCCCLPLETVYNVCHSFGLEFNKESHEVVLKKLGVIHGDKNDTVSYHSFCNLLDCTKPLPQVAKIDDLADEWKFYESTYQALTKDYDSSNEYESIKPSGVPSMRIDRDAPQDGICKGETFLLLDENGVDSCLRPSVFTSYGLHPRDFFELKTKDYIKDLWKRVGVTIPDDLFELMWSEALTREENDAKNNMVCIETFRNILDEMSAAKLIEMQEA